MEFAEFSDRRQAGIQNLPEFNDQVFAAAKLSFHEVDIGIEVFMIDLINHAFPDEGA